MFRMNTDMFLLSYSQSRLLLLDYITESCCTQSTMTVVNIGIRTFYLADHQSLLQLLIAPEEFTPSFFAIFKIICTTSGHIALLNWKGVIMLLIYLINNMKDRLLVCITLLGHVCHGFMTTNVLTLPYSENITKKSKPQIIFSSQN